MLVGSSFFPDIFRDEISRNKYTLLDATSNFVRGQPTDRSILPLPSYFGNVT